MVLGEHNWSTRSSAREETKYSVEKIVRHHKFGRAAQFDYDFALIKLNRRVKFNQHIRWAADSLIYYPTNLGID